VIPHAYQSLFCSPYRYSTRKEVDNANFARLKVLPLPEKKYIARDFPVSLNVTPYVPSPFKLQIGLQRLGEEDIPKRSHKASGILNRTAGFNTQSASDLIEDCGVRLLTSPFTRLEPK
jgi:hypothetical protein